MSKEIYKQDSKGKKVAIIIAIFLIVIVGVLVFIFRNDISKAFRKLWGSSTQIVVNSGTLMEGNFPISVTNDDIDYQFGKMGNNFVMLSDTHMYIYSTNGELKDTREHDYSNSILKTSNKRALVYESGGKNFKVEGSRNTIYTREMENSIVFARINEKGYVAVITTAEMYSCELTIYNEHGEEVYNRGCVDRIEDLCFTNSNDGCIVATVDALEGQIITKVMYLNFNSQEDTWTSQPLETLCLDIQMTDDGNIFLFGDTKCAYYDMQGNQLGGYSYKNDLISGYSENGKCAIIFENEERRKTTMLLMDNYESTPIELVVDNDIKKIYIEDGLVYVLRNTALETYNFEGTLLATSEVSDVYKNFIKIDDEIFLISYDSINKIEYQSD
ncbi:MAG: DUF5711 family protein [Ruminococcus sp.]|nr:DUF5711 family protein [Ruminococcus sp.]